MFALGLLTTIATPPEKKRGFRCFPHTSNMAFDGWLSWKIRGKWESQSLA